VHLSFHEDTTRQIQYLLRVFIAIIPVETWKSKAPAVEGKGFRMLKDCGNRGRGEEFFHMSEGKADIHG